MRFFSWRNAVVVARHQTDADLEVLCLGALVEFEHALAGRPVDGLDGLLHENVEALLDRVHVMHPTKRWRRREDHDVAGAQTVHRFAITTKAHELVVLGNVHLLRKLLRQRVDHRLGLAFKNVSYGHQFNRCVWHRESVGRRTTTAAAAATDQGDADRVATGDVDLRAGCAGEHGGGGESAGSWRGSCDEWWRWAAENSSPHRSANAGRSQLGQRGCVLPCW